MATLDVAISVFLSKYFIKSELSSCNSRSDNPNEELVVRIEVKENGSVNDKEKIKSKSEYKNLTD